MGSLDLDLGNGMSLVNGGKAAPAAPALPYDLAPFYAAMSVQPNSDRKAMFQTLADGLKADGEIARLKALLLTAAHDAQATRVNMVDPSNIWTVVGSVAWSEDGYLQGDGAGSYLESGIAENNALPWSQDSAAFSVWVSVESTVGNSLLGLSGNILTRIIGAAGGVASGRIHTGSVSATTLDTYNLITVVRVDANTAKIYRNGALEGTVSAASTALTAFTFQLFKTNATTGNPGISMLSIGSARNDAQEAAFYARMLTFLTDMGVA